MSFFALLWRVSDLTFLHDLPVSWSASSFMQLHSTLVCPHRTAIVSCCIYLDNGDTSQENSSLEWHIPVLRNLVLVNSHISVQLALNLILTSLLTVRKIMRTSGNISVFCHGWQFLS